MRLRLAEVAGLSARPNSLAASPDGETIACTLFETKKLRIGEADTLAERKTIHLGQAFTRGCAFSADSSEVVAGQKELKVFSLATYKPVRKLEGHRHDVTHVQLCASGTLAITASGVNVEKADCSVRTWDFASGKELSRWKLPTAVDGLAVRPDGSFAIGVTAGGEIVGGVPGQKEPLWTSRAPSPPKRAHGILVSAVLPSDLETAWIGGHQGELFEVSAADGSMMRQVRQADPWSHVAAALVDLPESACFLAGFHLPGHLRKAAIDQRGARDAHIAVLDRDGVEVCWAPVEAGLVVAVAASSNGDAIFAATAEPDALRRYVVER